MDNYPHTEHRTPSKGPNHFGMNRYEWAVAKERADAAMLLGDLTLLALAKARTMVLGVLKALRGTSNNAPVGTTR